MPDDFFVHLRKTPCQYYLASTWTTAPSPWANPPQMDATPIPPPSSQFINERHQNSCSAGPYRMTNGNGTPIDIRFL